MKTDGQLLAEYRAGSQAAFSTLVERHIDWVYSAAARRVGNAHLAEDVTQAVFIAMGKNGPTSQGVVMSAWLFTVMRFASSKALRSESRRRHHEAEAARQRQATPEADGEEFKKLLPLLERAVDDLGRGDREAILLRFYQRYSFPEVAAALRISEDGARKRVLRAVAKLRGTFARQGSMIPACLMAERLLRHAATSAPSGLATTIASTSAESVLAKAAIGALKLRTFLHAACFAAAILAAAMIPVGLHFAAADIQTTPAPAPGNASAPPTSQPAMAAEPATRPVDVTFAQIIAGVQKAEGKIQNLYIKDFETTEEKLPKGGADWVWTPERFTGSAWYDGDPRGKARVYFADIINPWIGGTSPWSEQTVDESWDGKEGREIRIAGGAMGTALAHANQAILSAAEPIYLSIGSTRWETGAGFSLQYRVGIEETTFPPEPHVPISAELEKLQQLLAQAHDAVTKIEIAGQTINGFNTIRLRAVDNFDGQTIIPFTYWFDPQHGYALVKSEREDGLPGQMQTSTLEIKELKQIAPGVWFPLRGSWTRPDVPDPGTYRRYNYHAADAVANDPNFDSSIFEATVPTGYLINDVTGPDKNLFMVMPDGKRQLVPRGEKLPFVRPSIATRPDQDAILPK